MRGAAGRRRNRPCSVTALCVLGILTIWSATVTAALMPAPASAETKLPTPRFVSLRFNNVNVRKGPATRYPIKWVYKKKGLPVEVLRDLGNWRLVRDRRRSTGWIHVRNLTSRRSVIVTVRRNSLHRGPDSKTAVVARLGQGVIAHLENCRGIWCRVRVQNVSGWLRRNQVWGIYAKEKIE